MVQHGTLFSSDDRGCETSTAKNNTRGLGFLSCHGQLFVEALQTLLRHCVGQAAIGLGRDNCMAKTNHAVLINNKYFFLILLVQGYDVTSTSAISTCQPSPPQSAEALGIRLCSPQALLKVQLRVFFCRFLTTSSLI